MASYTRTFFGNRAGVHLFPAGTDVTKPTTNPDYPLLIVKDFKAEFQQELAPLYGNGSIARQDIARHTVKVDVSFKFHKMDISTDDSELMKTIVGGNVATKEFDVGANDTSDVQLFDIYAVMDSDEETDLHALRVTVYDVAFNNFPLAFNDTDWVGFEFTGEGAGIKLENEASYMKSTEE